MTTTLLIAAILGGLAGYHITDLPKIKQAFIDWLIQTETKEWSSEVEGGFTITASDVRAQLDVDLYTAQWRTWRDLRAMAQVSGDNEFFPVLTFDKYLNDTIDFAVSRAIDHKRSQHENA